MRAEATPPRRCVSTTHTLSMYAYSSPCAPHGHALVGTPRASGGVSGPGAGEQTGAVWVPRHTSATQTPFSVLAQGPALQETSRQPHTASVSRDKATRQVQAREEPTGAWVLCLRDRSSRSANSRSNVGRKRLGNGRLCCSRSVS